LQCSDRLQYVQCRWSKPTDINSEATVPQLQSLTTVQDGVV
jgi:hypothetical protein